MQIDPELIPKIKMVAPGTLLRRALDDIIMAEFGALIVFLDDIREQINEINTLIARISQTIGTVERYKSNLDKKCLRIERDEFLDQVQLIQVTELLNDCIGIMSLLEEIDPYVVETGSVGHPAESRRHRREESPVDC